MFDGLPLQFLASASPWLVTVSILVAVARMIYTGALVPRPTYRDTQEQQERFIAGLKEALDEERETNRYLMNLVRDLQAPSAKAVDILETVQEVSGRSGGSG